jgi:hypothetical protein
MLVVDHLHHFLCLGIRQGVLCSPRAEHGFGGRAIPPLDDHLPFHIPSFVHNDAAGKCLKQLAALLMGYILPALDNQFQRRTRFQHHGMLSYIRPDSLQFHPQTGNLAVIGFVAGFQIFNDLRVGDSLEVIQNSLFGTFSSTDVLFNPSDIALIALMGTVQRLPPGLIVDGGGFQAFEQQLIHYRIENLRVDAHDGMAQTIRQDISVVIVVV